MKNKNSRLVYSTDQGRIKPQDEELKVSHASADGIVRIQRETKGRGGKSVTVLSGFDMDDSTLKEFAKKLKQQCGTGGTAKQGKIEIQGDHRQKLLDYVVSQGFKAKIAGG
ncbi:hypothetical protein TDB9533_04060 [Thalassocella blandensis]|nr:hypothetical protein TDB9533_04060 [Thalassocella blandensis]